MDQNFLKFKKRIWTQIIVKCVLAGLAAGLFATVAVMLPCHLCKIGLFWYVYLGIAVLGFVLGGGVAFLILKTDDRKIAKILDADLCLEERMQTAFVFAGQENAMLDLQRANANFALGKVPLKALPFKNIVATVLCAAVAGTSTVAIPVIAVCLPVVPIGTELPDGDDKEDPPRIVTDWEWGALDELINYVRSSKKADARTRTAMVSELEGLKNVLLDGVSQSSLPMFVENTVTNIRNEVKDANDAVDSEEQKKANTEEQNYVINKLYEIFSLQQPGSSEEPDPDEPDNPDEPDKPDEPEGPTGPGDLIVDKTPSFGCSNHFAPAKSAVFRSICRDFERITALFLCLFGDFAGTKSRSQTLPKYKLNLVNYFLRLFRHILPRKVRINVACLRSVR